MAIAPGTYRLGPDDGTLWVRTGRTGAVARAGHDLLIHVTAWEATLELGVEPDDGSAALTADATSLRVIEGTGGMQALDDGDRDNIRQTIDAEVLMGTEITFRSSEVRVAPGKDEVSATGELLLVGTPHPIAFELRLSEDGRLTGSAVVKQTEWGMKPYSALFGALKVADEVEVGIDVALPAPS
jgi:polyisoprenoid-binding protein YceI